MRKHAILLVLVMCSVGCASFRRQNTVTAVGWRQAGLAKYDEIVREFEATGKLPVIQGAKFNPYGPLTPSVAYAGRSASRVRHDPVMSWSRSCLRSVKNSRSLKDRCGKLFLWLPCTLVRDVIRIPIQCVRTLRVPRSEIDSALLDLKTARSLGYQRKQFSIGWFDTSATHLDVLATKGRQEGQNDEQSPSDDSLKAASEE